MISQVIHKPNIVNAPAAIYEYTAKVMCWGSWQSMAAWYTMIAKGVTLYHAVMVYHGSMVFHGPWFPQLGNEGFNMHNFPGNK